MSYELLLSPETPITCPKCAAEFSLSDGFAKKALESVEEASAEALAKVRATERAQSERESKRVEEERAAAHEKSLAEIRRITEESFKPQLEALRGQLTESQTRNQEIEKREAALAERERGMGVRVQQEAAAKAAELVAGERQAYEKRLAEQMGIVRTLQAEQLELRQQRQALQDEKAAMALEVQRQVDARLGERDTQVRAQEQERAALEKAELQKKLDDLDGQLRDAQRKIAQGSQQLQGEVLELAIEESLKRAFPLDTIEEVKKGQRGGDVLQHVMTRTGQEAGIILWETKRAKDWQSAWTVKLKEDMRMSGATVGVLVTMPGALPRDWTSGDLFATYDEVWVTQFSTALGLAGALRDGIVGMHKQRLVSAGKGEKMEALYDYLTSPHFAQKLRAIYDTFKRMKDELESEKNQTMQRWARREKQLQGGVTQLLGIGGDIQGLAQQELRMLELEEPKTEEGMP
jgi:hypothetical protein